MHSNTMRRVCPGTQALSAMHYGHNALCRSGNGSSLAVETLRCN